MRNPSSPQVSVVVPMRNAEPYISECLQSILWEKHTAIEVLIVNDGSSDSSLDRVLAVEDPRIRILDGPLRGISACLNVGLREAKGSIIMRCDADDVYPQRRIEQQARWLEDNPQFGAVCGAFSTIDAKGKLITLMPCGASSTEITGELASGKSRTSLCTFAIRSSAVEKVGGFREFFETGEDVDFQLRVGEVCRVMYLPSDWYSYRIHPSSITHRQKSDRQRFYEWIAKDFQLQRKNTGADALEKGLFQNAPDTDLEGVLNAADHIKGLLIGRAWGEHEKGKKLAALQFGLRALQHDPASIWLWKSVLALAIKRRKAPS